MSEESSIRLFSFDIEVYQFNFIIGISVHTTPSLDKNSGFQNKLFIASDLTPEAVKEVLIEFLDYLKENKGAILTSYNLIGFDLPVLLTRSREYYPLGLLASLC